MYPTPDSTSANLQQTLADLQRRLAEARAERDEILGGRRPKSLRGGNRGGVCTDAGVDLWGICRRCLT